MRSVWPLVGLLCLVCGLSSFAGVLYTDKELWVTGQEWTTTQVMWERERLSHAERLQAIEGSGLPETHKEFMRRQEFTRHKQASDQLALQRDRIQNVLIDEANARVRGGTAGDNSPSSQLRDTAGTRVGEEGHRGMVGDRDMGGGERTVAKVKEVLQDMGLYNPNLPEGQSPLVIRETAGTLEVGGDFELTINKTGLRPKPGTEFHRIKAAVDARNPETYLSESMKVRNEAGDVVSKDVGADYCETQDHRKKAAKGHCSDGPDLVRNPDKMQAMAKGTVKTLDMGDVPDETLNAILKQNGITDSPEVFRDKLRQIKEQKLGVTDAAEAERLRRASQDIFNASEQEVFRRTKRDIVDLRRRASELPEGHPDRLRIEEEIVDSVTKMKATKAANDEFLAAHAGRGRSSPAAQTDSPGPKTAPVDADAGRRPALEAPDAAKPFNVEAELEGIEKVRMQSDGGRARKTFDALTQISDIGQSCQLLEDYMEGKATLTDVIVATTDQFVTGGLIGTTQNAYNAQKTYHEGADTIRNANHNNMAAYLLQWELQFRRAGLSREQARREISTAVLSGNLDHLKDRGQALIAQGRKIDPPKLVVETYDVSDEFALSAYAERTWDTLWGIPKGIAQGVGYIVMAPSRTVEAWAEGELREAELAEYSATQEAHARPAMFRKLIKAGIDTERARAAIAAWDEGNTAPLRAAFKEARANIAARQPTPQQQAAAQAEADRIKAKLDRDTGLLRRYNLLLNYLRWAPATLVQDPMPVELAEEGESAAITLALQVGRPGEVEAVCKEIEGILTELTGAQPRVSAEYKFSCAGLPGARPNLWRSQSPKIPGVYPVTATLDVSVTGPGLTGPFAMLKKSVEREAFLGVDVALNPDKMDLHGEIWATLRRTPNLSISIPAFEYSATVTPAGVMRFPTKRSGKTENETFWTEEGEATVRMTSDGAHVREVFIELHTQIRETPDGPVFNEYKTRIRFENLPLHEHVPVSEIRAGEVNYWIAAKGETPVGSWQGTQRDENGRLTWQPATTIYANTPGRSCWVFFTMSQEDRDAISAQGAAVRRQKQQQQQAARADAASGRHYAGPFAQAEGLTGTIQIDVSLEKKTVSARFKAERLVREDRKAMVTGEWLGTIDPDTGAINAKVTKGSIGTWRKTDGHWYPPPPYDEQGFSDNTRVVGELDGDTITGHFELQGNTGFAFKATLTPLEPEK